MSSNLSGTLVVAAVLLAGHEGVAARPPAGSAAKFHSGGGDEVAHSSDRPSQGSPAGARSSCRRSIDTWSCQASAPQAKRITQHADEGDDGQRQIDRIAEGGGAPRQPHQAQRVEREEGQHEARRSSPRPRAAPRFRPAGSRKPSGTRRYRRRSCRTAAPGSACCGNGPPGTASCAPGNRPAGWPAGSPIIPPIDEHDEEGDGDRASAR